MEVYIWKQLWDSLNHPVTGSILNWDQSGVPKPLHLHPYSRRNSSEFDPSDPLQSCIFVCPWSEYLKLPSEEIQAVFNQRHILVYGVPHSHVWEWSLFCIDRVNSILAWLQIQSAFFLVAQRALSLISGQAWKIEIDGEGCVDKRTPG